MLPYNGLLLLYDLLYLLLLLCVYFFSIDPKIDGKRHQRVDIHYNTIGLWCAPSPEEMEKLFQEHLADKRKKTA